MSEWNVTFTIGGNNKRVRNISTAKLDLKLDGLSEFQVVLRKPAGWQISDIADDIDCSITAGNHALSGLVQNHKYTRGSNTKVVSGGDYSLILRKMFIHTDNTSSEDATLSSDFRVVYTSTVFAAIAADILTNSGVGTGTIDTFPPGGPDTSMGIKFEDMKVWGGFLDLIKYAHVSNVPYDVWVDNSKDLQLQDRRGNDTPTFTLRDDVNCKVTNFEGDTIRKAKRVIVRGSRSGSNQVTGVWPAAGHTAGDPEEGFYAPSITDATMAGQLAHNLYEALNTEITFLIITVNNPDLNVQLGDDVNFESEALSISATEYRVVRILKRLRNKRESLTLYLSVAGNKQRKKTLSELFAQNRGLQRLTGSTSKGSVKTMTFAFNGKTHNTNKFQSIVNLSTGLIASDADIISARLKFKRVALDFDVDANTGSGAANFTGDVLDDGPTTSVQEAQQLDTTFRTYNSGAYRDILDTAGAVASFSASATDTQGLFVNCAFGMTHSGSGSFTVITCRVVSASDSGFTTDLRYFPDIAIGVQIMKPIQASINVHDTGTLFRNIVQELPNYVSIFVPENTASRFYKLQINPTNNLTTQNRLHFYTISQHSHPDDLADSGHTNPITRDVFRPGGEASHTFTIDVDSVNTGLSTSLAVNAFSGEFGLTSVLNTRGPHTIEIYPTGGGEKGFIIGELHVDYWSDDLL